MLRWTLGYTCLFPFWFPLCVCKTVFFFSALFCSVNGNSFILYIQFIFKTYRFFPPCICLKSRYFSQSPLFLLLFVYAHACSVNSDSFVTPGTVAHWLGSSVHRIFPARLQEWVAISSSVGLSQPRIKCAPESPVCRRMLHCSATSVGVTLV